MTTYTNGTANISLIEKNKDLPVEELYNEIKDYNSQVSPAGQIPIPSQHIKCLTKMWVDRVNKIKLLQYGVDTYRCYKYYGNGNNVELKENRSKKGDLIYYMIKGKRFYINHLLNEYEWNNIYNYSVEDLPPTTQEVIEEEDTKDLTEYITIKKADLKELVEESKTLYNKNIEQTIHIHKLQICLEALIN